MPNHCYQQVYIQGPHYLVSMLYSGLTENGYDPLRGGRAKNPQYSDDTYPNGPVAWFSFRCWTAWGAPIPVWDRLHAMGIEVQADYHDEGGMFEGEYHHGEDRSWDPQVEEECA